MAFVWAFHVALVVKSLPANVGDRGDASSVSGLGRLPGGGNGNPLQYCLEDPIDRGTWRATVHMVVKSWTRLKQLSTHACMAFVYAS